MTRIVTALTDSWFSINREAEGVVVLPARLAEEIAHAAFEVEQRESFALERVNAGESFRGLYPLSAERQPEYEQWRDAQRDAKGSQ